MIAHTRRRDTRRQLNLREWLFVLGVLRAYLVLNGVGQVAGGLMLLLLPDRLVSGPSYAVVFRQLPRQAWGVMFILVGLSCFTALIRDNRWTRLSIVSLLTLQTMWAIGLTAPIFLAGRANAMAPIAWIMLLATTILVVWYSGGPPKVRR